MMLSGSLLTLAYVAVAVVCGAREELHFIGTTNDVILLCEGRPANVTATWYMNGTLIEDLPPSLNISTDPKSNGRRLRIAPSFITPGHNGSIFKCIDVSVNGGNRREYEEIVIIIEDPLVASSILSVENGVASLNWSQPVTRVTTPLSYLVEIYDKSSFSLRYSDTITGTSLRLMRQDLVQCLSCGACRTNVTVETESHIGPPVTAHQVLPQTTSRGHSVVITDMDIIEGDIVTRVSLEMVPAVCFITSVWVEDMDGNKFNLAIVNSTNYTGSSNHTDLVIYIHHDLVEEPYRLVFEIIGSAGHRTLRTDLILVSSSSTEVSPDSEAAQNGITPLEICFMVVIPVLIVVAIFAMLVICIWRLKRRTNPVNNTSRVALTTEEIEVKAADKKKEEGVEAADKKKKEGVEADDSGNSKSQLDIKGNSDIAPHWPRPCPTLAKRRSFAESTETEDPAGEYIQFTAVGGEPVSEQPHSTPKVSRTDAPVMEQCSDSAPQEYVFLQSLSSNSLKDQLTTVCPPPPSKVPEHVDSQVVAPVTTL